MKKKFIIIFFFSFLLFFFGFFIVKNKQNVNNSYVACKDLGYEKSLFFHPSNFSPVNLEINFPSEKKWKKILFESELEAKKNFNTSNTKFYVNSKRINSIVNVKYSENLYCQIKAEIRPHGLLDDHRDGSSVLPSLNVNLKDGNIFGITKFILFRPNTRSWNNEIIITNILRSLGFLAPRTTKSVVKYNNQLVEFIFQERIVKEFLEANNVKEGPLYEGDGKFFYYLNNDNSKNKYFLTKHKLINNNWPLFNDNTMKISKKGLSILNRFLDNYIFNLENERLLPADYHTLEKKFYNSEYFKDLDIFDSLNFALGAAHGLSIDDRIYYFDSLYNKFIPIYWDGMANIVNRFDNILKSFNDKKIILTESAKTGSSLSLKLINQLDVESLEKHLIVNKVNLNKNQIIEIINKVKNNLKIYEDIQEDQIIKLYDKNKFKITFDEQKSLNNKDFIFLYEDKSFSNILACDVNGFDCKNKELTKKDFSKLLNADYNTNKNFYIYTSKSQNLNGKSLWYDEFISNSNNTRKILFQDLKFLINGSIDFQINETEKIIIFEKNSKYGNVIFLNSSIDGWNIKFNNYINEEYIGNDEMNVTGCLNFYDSNLVNTQIEIDNANCEDAVNFVRSSGNIKNIKISKSFSDSIDADFSNLHFDNILIKESKNDCIDFSYGSYFIDKAIVENCGDKGLSNGETSVSSVNEIIVKNSNSGIVSKDFAKALVKNASIIDTNICFGSYNKKQEFGGGFLEVKNYNCKKFKDKNILDTVSILKVN